MFRRALHERSALLVAALFVALNALTLVQGVRSIHAVEDAIPLRLNAEVGVVAVGQWWWLLAPLFLNVLFLAINALLLWRFRAPEIRSMVIATTVLVSFFFLFGVVATLRAALLSL